MNCGCTTTCGCGTISSAPICRLSKVAYLKAFNEDGCEVALTGNGLLVSEDGAVYYTDGSINQGQVKFNPENTGGVNSLLGISSDGDPSVVGIGKDADEGSTFVFISGQWQVRPVSQSKNTFNSASFKGGKRIAAFSCSSSGIVDIGYLDLTNDTYLYIDEDGNYSPKTLTQLTETFLLGLCPLVPDKAADEVITKIIGCTAEGKIIKGSIASVAVYLPIPQLVYSQHKTNGPIINPGSQVAYIPPGGPITSGIFTTNFVDLDLETIPGYSSLAHSVVIILRAGSFTQVSNGGWDLVGVIQGFEYIRIPNAQSYDVRKANNEVKIKIPEGTSKVIRLEGIRQVDNGGPSAHEFGVLEMFIKCFEF